MTFADLTFPEQTFEISCSRKKHTIKTTRRGYIYFVDHHTANLRAIMAEGQLRRESEPVVKAGTTLRGCALIAFLLLHARDARDFQYKGRRRTTKMRELHELGVPDEFMTDFLLASIRRSGMRHLSRKNADPLNTPFVGPPGSATYHTERMGPRLKALFQKEHEKLLKRFEGPLERARLQRGISTK